MLFGFWRHKKGGIYLILGEGRQTETQEPYIFYVGFSGNVKLWARPHKMFLDGRFKPMYGLTLLMILFLSSLLVWIPILCRSF